MIRPRPLLVLLAWLLPAGFFAFTAVAKLVTPEGSAPRLLAGLLGLASWPTWLRVLAVVELAVAGLLVLPRTRRTGRLAAFALLAGLSVLLAIAAADKDFIANCGCMGGLGKSPPRAGQVEWLLLRNGALLFVVALGAYLDGPVRLAAAAGRAATAAGLVLLATLYTGEHVRRLDAEDAHAADELLADATRSLGWFVPDVPVVDDAGARVSLRAWTRPNDELLVLSTACGHCAGAAPEVKAIAARLATEKRRLALLLIEAPGAPGAEGWLEAHGFGGLPHARLLWWRDARLIGIDRVPGWLRLDGDARVSAHEVHGGFPSLAASLAAAEEQVPGLSAAAWSLLAQRLAGREAVVRDVRRLRDDGWEAALSGPDGLDARLLVRGDGAVRGFAVELAGALSQDGRLLRLVALATGSHTPLVAPTLAADLEALQGKTLSEARDAARARVGGGSLASGVWRSIHRVLEHWEAATRPFGAPPR